MSVSFPRDRDHTLEESYRKTTFRVLLLDDTRGSLMLEREERCAAGRE